MSRQSSTGRGRPARLPALAAALVPAALLIASCGGPRVRAPEGFAPLERGFFAAGAYVLRAMSPEGMRFQVRAVKNEPRQDLAFWGEALRTHLVNEGYRPSGEPQGFTTDDSGRRAIEGRLLEWVMPYGAETWSYLTAVVVAGRRILIVEAAGERALYEKHRAAVLASLRTLAP